jgi:hypothetical protein
MDYEASKQVLEELGRVLSEKSELDLSYSKSLSKLGNSFDKMIHNQYTSPNIKELLSSLQSLFLSQAEHSEVFSRSLRNEVVQTIKKLLSSQFEKLKF